MSKTISVIQTSGDNSKNEQNVSIIVKNTKEIIINLFYQNFPNLVRTAAKTAKERANIFVNDLLLNCKLETLDKFKEPSVQWIVLKAETEYAKSGNDHKKDLMIGTLKERLCSDEQSLKQIILDETIQTIPKLSQVHLDILSFVFVVQELALRELQRSYIDDNIVLDIESIIKDAKLFNKQVPKNIRKHVIGHLEYLGCIRELPEFGTMFDTARVTIGNLLERYKDSKIGNISKELETVDRDLTILYRAWNMKKLTIKLTTVGLMLAITNYNYRKRTDVISVDDFL